MARPTTPPPSPAPGRALRRAGRAWGSLVALLGFGLLPACTIWSADTLDDANRNFGWRPVYITPEEAYDIGSEEPRAFVDAITPIVFGDRLYVVDRLRGVHVIDNADPSAPVSLAFIRIPGVTTATVSEDRLYADNVGDIVTIDISDLERVRVLDRETGAFGLAVGDFPEGEFGWFECVDRDRGFVIEWEEAALDDPQCRL